MSAFTPYKKIEKVEENSSPTDLRIRRNNTETRFPIDFTSVLFNLSPLRRDTFRVGHFETGKSSAVEAENKSEKFLIKNILRNDDSKEKEKRERKRFDFEEQASQMETLVSNLGKSDRGHRCIYCGKIYSRKYGLKIHIRTHTGYKPLKCKYCLRPFGDPSNLNKHVRLHARGHTPYNCKFCGKILVRRRDLERHVKSKHSDIS